MNRRDLLTSIAAGSAATVSSPLLAQAGLGVLPADKYDNSTASGKALNKLAEVIKRKSKSFQDGDWRLQTAAEQAEARRMLMHAVQHAIETRFNADPARPQFTRFVTPTKKLLGDNPDAVYFEAQVSPDHEYRIRGNIAGATYTSFTVELAKKAGSFGTLGATLNDTEFDVDRDGNYEIIASVRKPAKGNWLELDASATSIVTRHYYETKSPIAADRLHHIPLLIDNLEDAGPEPLPDDTNIEAGLVRAANWLDANINPPSPQLSPRWVSKQPNVLPAPKIDESNKSVGYAAADNVYSMAPWVLKPDEALEIRGRWPRARFASVVLWNRFMQTLDYVNRSVSLNRVQTVAEGDGSFRMILAHQDPGLPNWLDTEGRVTGVLFWRFQLPEHDIEPLTTRVVKFSDLRGG